MSSESKRKSFYLPLNEGEKAGEKMRKICLMSCILVFFCNFIGITSAAIAAKPYADCSSFSSDLYERSAARLHQAIGIIENELTNVTGDHGPSNRLREAFKESALEINFLKQGADQAMHDFPSPNLSAVNGVYKEISGIMQRHKNNLLEIKRKILMVKQQRREAERTKRKLMVKGFNEMFSAQIQLYIGALTAPLSGPGAIAYTIGDSTSNIIGIWSSKEPRLVTPTFAKKHQPEVSEKMEEWFNIHCSNPHYRREYKFRWGIDLNEKGAFSKLLKQPSFQKIYSRAMLKQIQHISKKWEKKYGNRQTDFEKKKDALKKKIKRISPNIEQFKKLCAQIMGLASWKKERGPIPKKVGQSKIPEKTGFRCRSNRGCWDLHGACNYYCEQTTGECIQCRKKNEHGKQDGTEGCNRGERVWPKCGSETPKVSVPKVPEPPTIQGGIGYYLCRLGLYLRVNGKSCKITLYSCAECTGEDIKWFMGLFRKQIQNSLGSVQYFDETSECVRSIELVESKVTVAQGPSKAPIKVPRPSTNCPCRNTPVFQSQLYFEYQPNCTPYEEVKKAKQLL